MGIKHGNPDEISCSWWHRLVHDSIAYTIKSKFHIFGNHLQIPSNLGKREAREIRLMAHKKGGLPYNKRLGEAI
jgi:hypothetical protein